MHLLDAGADQPLQGVVDERHVQQRQQHLGLLHRHRPEALHGTRQPGASSVSLASMPYARRQTPLSDEDLGVAATGEAQASFK